MILLFLCCVATSTYVNINWDTFTGLPDFVEMVDVMLELRNQSVASAFRPHDDAGVITHEEHDSVHSEEHDSLHSARSKSEFPHSFLLTPVYEIPNDSESKIVAYFSGGFSWGFALRNLLPDNVEGIVVEIQNTCNQSNLYELVGTDAFYLGENATKESKYTDMEVARDLSFGSHPNYNTTPGHCIYSIVSNGFICIHTVQKFSGI